MSDRISCYQKRRYPTEKIAMREKRIREAQISYKLRAYPCFNCGGYHLTSLVVQDSVTGNPRAKLVIDR